MVARCQLLSQYNAQQIYVKKVKQMINRIFFKTSIDHSFHERDGSLLGIVVTTCNTATLETISETEVFNTSW